LKVPMTDSKIMAMMSSPGAALSARRRALKRDKPQLTRSRTQQSRRRYIVCADENAAEPVEFKLERIFLQVVCPILASWRMTDYNNSINFFFCVETQWLID
jgi:hypothetical protein